MKNLFLFLFSFSVLLFSLSGCEKPFEDELSYQEPGAGPSDKQVDRPFNNSGNNVQKVFVQDPLGNILVIGDQVSSEGRLNFDCPSRKLNIYWTMHRQGHIGEYTFWIKNLNACDSNGKDIEFILHVVLDTEVIKVMKGTITADKAPLFTYVHTVPSAELNRAYAER